MNRDPQLRSVDRLRISVFRPGRLLAALFCLALISPSLAHAKCAQWDVSRLPPGQEWGIVQSNGYLLGFIFQQHGSSLQGSAGYWPEGGKRTSGAIVNGSVTGNLIRFTVNWYDGTSGTYVGTIDDQGGMKGNTVDKHNNVAATWTAHASQKAFCVTEASAPKPEPTYWSGKSMVGVALNTNRPGNDFTMFDPPAADAVHCFSACSSDSRCKAWTYVKPGISGAGATGRCHLKDPAPNTQADACCVSGYRGKRLGKAKTQTPPPPAGGSSVRAILDVDTYNAPGGNGKKLGILRQGSVVTLLSPCQDNWCNVSGKNVPTGIGWVYDGPDYPSLQH